MRHTFSNWAGLIEKSCTVFDEKLTSPLFGFDVWTIIAVLVQFWRFWYNQEKNKRLKHLNLFQKVRNIVIRYAGNLFLVEQKFLKVPNFKQQWFLWRPFVFCCYFFSLAGQLLLYRFFFACLFWWMPTRKKSFAEFLRQPDLPHFNFRSTNNLFCFFFWMESNCFQKRKYFCSFCCR